MGFESSHMARRRLATLAMSNSRVQDALSTSPHAPLAGSLSDRSAYDTTSQPSLFGAERHTTSSAGTARANKQAIALELESLAQDIADTPGAGGALLATFAEQARVLQLVAQAAERTPGAPLPADVLAAVHAAVVGADTGCWDDAIA